ncbi:MAG: cytochrome C [Sulfurovaceae bacterium]|nr:cytochrome C [Sulfurovaceae bacterium]
MVKHSLITIVTLGLITVSASAYDTKACAGCHGKDFEKKAMGVSKVVKESPKDEIVKALKGYKAKTFGGPMKAIMQGQAAALSDKEIEEIATQIAGGDKKAEDNATKADANATKKAETNTTAK